MTPNESALIKLVVGIGFAIVGGYYVYQSYQAFNTIEVHGTKGLTKIIP